MANNRIDAVLAKYRWAQKHLDELEAAIENFRRDHRYTIRREDDPERGEATFYVRTVPDIPVEIPLKLGDVLHNLRGTLDHLANALVVAAGGTPDKHTGFPIFDTPKAYKDTVGSRVKGVGQHCLHQLDMIAPYKGGFGHWAWQLHNLDIINKHRLILTVARVPVGRTMTPNEREQFRTRKTLIGPNAFAAIQYTRAVSSPSFAPVHAGHNLGTFPISEVDENMGFSFDIAINEPDYVGLVPTFLLLRGFASEVYRAIGNLEYFLC